MWVVQVEAAFLLLPWMRPQDHQDGWVGGQEKEEQDEDQHPTIGNDKELQEGSVHAAKSQHLWNITEII